jgi:hypothetical protein
MSAEHKKEQMSSAASMVEHAEKLGVLRDDHAKERAESGRLGGRLASLAGDFRLLLAGLWLGAAVYFSFAVAPSAFAVLPTRELAGTLVNRTLGIVNLSGFTVSVLLLLTLPLVKRAASRLEIIPEAVSLLLLVIATAVGQWVIAARLHELRARLGGPVEGLAKSDPARVAFDALHGYSVKALMVAMLAALVAFLLMARRGRRSSRSS